MRRCKNNSPELIGKRFGRLTVVGFSWKKTYSAHAWHWDCKCDCGNMAYGLKPYNVKSGQTTSCGCLKTEQNYHNLAASRTTHGLTNHPLHHVWCGIKNRCDNPNEPAYKNYGARGIKMCSEWHDDFQAFYDWAIKTGYAKGLTIERKNVNKGYSPDNCCWIPRSEQAKNKRDIRYVELNGKKMSLRAACEQLGLPYKAVHLRVTRQGMNVKDALSKPFKDKEHTIKRRCEEAGLPYGTVVARLKAGWDEERAFSQPVRRW